MSSQPMPSHEAEAGEAGRDADASSASPSALHDGMEHDGMTHEVDAALCPQFTSKACIR